MRRFFARLGNLLRGSGAEREMAREIESHLALLQEGFERRGVPPAEARLAARRAYGGVEQAKELHRETRSFIGIEHLLKDVRYGVRSLLGTPGFTAVAVVALALGIGASTAIFSVVNAVLLHEGTDPVAVANYIDWREQSRSFEGMGAAQFWTPNITGGDSPEHIPGLQVTQSLFPMLGTEPLLGRLFVAGEDQKGAEHELILSHRLWQRRFNGDAGVLGKTVTLDGEFYGGGGDAAGIQVCAVLGDARGTVGAARIRRARTRSGREQSARVCTIEAGRGAGRGPGGGRDDHRTVGAGVSRLEPWCGGHTA